MPAFIDITGNKYSRLTVIERGESLSKKTRWKCLCDCGNTTVVSGHYLKSGRTKSCGCYQKEVTSNRFKVHGKNKETKYRRHVSLKYKYGISMETYNEMFENQNGLCKICNYKFGQKKADCYVDHDHKTLEVRGLLCRNCNTGLGMFKDNKQFLQQAIDYLERQNHVHA
jgi:hypothetical protein